MLRRQFLVLLGAAPVSLALLRRAGADLALEDEPRNLTLADAQGVARRRGVPLFVIVIPAATDQWWQRGAAWGELLNHGPAEDLAPLAHAEVACATLKELEARYGLVAGSGPEPVAVTVAPDGKTTSVFAAALPPTPDQRRAGAPSEDEVVAERMSQLGALVRAALGAVPREQTRSLTAAVRKRIVKRPPPGSHWGNASGCGSHLEPTPEELAAKERKRVLAERARRRAAARGELQPLVLLESVGTVGCGMGSVPELSRRFLAFYTADSNDK